MAVCAFNCPHDALAWAIHMSLPLPTANAELRSHAIAERDVAVKQTREKRAKLYGQTFDLIHGLRQFGCHLSLDDPSLVLADGSIQARARFIDACFHQDHLAQRLLHKDLIFLDADHSQASPQSAATALPVQPDTTRQIESRPFVPLQPADSVESALSSLDASAGPSSADRARDLIARQQPEGETSASSSRESAEPSESLAAFSSQAQQQNTANLYRFASPAPQIASDDANKPFSQDALDRHSPSFNPDAPPNAATGFSLPNQGAVDPQKLLPSQQRPAHPSMTTVAAPQQQQQPRASTSQSASRLSYVDALPELPADLLHNRVAVGGLLRQKREKEKERHPHQPTHYQQHQNALSGGTELYRTGQLQASLLGVRHHLGTPPVGDPTVDPKLRTVRPAKAVSTHDWGVAYQELELQRTMEKIDALKAQNLWSFRQPKKQKGPAVHKTHWDYLLDEMRWMQTDFRQERRWKQATAFEISTWILEYHAASPERRKNELCIKTRPPNLLPTPREGEETGSRPRNAPQANEEEDDEEPDDTDEDLQVKSELLDEDGQHHASTSAQPLQQQNGNTAIVAASQTAAPLSFGRVIQNRGPLFEQSESKTTISLSDLPLDALLPSSAKERTAPELLAGLLPDLGSYAPPAPPSNDEEMFRARRTDLSSPSHSRLTPVSRFMDDKPLLLSTLNPASKRKWATGEWEDLSDLYTAEDPPQPGPVPDASAQSNLFAGRKQREGENAAPSASTSRAGEAAKPQPRNRAVFEAMRKLQKKRESLPPKLAPTAPRCINLTAHETHAVTPPRTLNPQDLSRLKGERDAAHHAMLRQQAVVRQQAQLAAAQAQLAAQQQAMSQQANSRFMQAQQAAAAHQGRSPSSQSQANGGSPAPAPAQSPPVPRLAGTPVPPGS